MSRPLIGITPESRFDPNDKRGRGLISLRWNYAEVVAQHGGVPILIPPTADPAEIAAKIDGWMLPGGHDIDAAEYGEQNHPTATVQDGSRFGFEKRLFQALSPAKPIFGICYGMQAINVLLGGTLESHLPDRLGHDNHSSKTVEPVCVIPGTTLHQITGCDEIVGHTSHHQAVGRLAGGLRIAAKHDDGTPEALESTTDRWIVAVQWHPERTPDDPATQKLFQAFIQAAGAKKI